MSVYVAYLSNSPVETSVKDMLENFQDKNHRLQQAGGLDGRSKSVGRIVTKRRRFCTGTYVKNGMTHSAILNILYN